MGRCICCHHPLRAEIELFYQNGGTLAQIEERYGISQSSMSRHNINHAQPKANPYSLLDQVHDIVEACADFLDDDADDARAIAAALAEGDTAAAARRAEHLATIAARAAAGFRARGGPKPKPKPKPPKVERGKVELPDW